MRKTLCLLVLGGLLSLLPAGQAGAQMFLEAYCCVCTACTSGAPVQCATVEVGTVSGDCTAVCSDIGCSSAKVEVEGTCPAPDACVGLLNPPAPAPALSWQVLTALALALTVGGVYRVRHRLRS